MASGRSGRSGLVARARRSPRDDDATIAIVTSVPWQEPERRWEVPWWKVRLGAALLVLSMVTLLVGGVTWGTLIRRDLQRERDALMARDDSMAVLAERLAALAARERQLRFLSGLEERREPDIWLRGASAASARDHIVEYAPGDTALAPTVWPVTIHGHITQSLFAGEARGHPGIDLAVPAGSYVRAAGAGQVLEAAEDSVYGKFVLLDHGDGVWSRYGHALYLAVERGQTVRKGEVIALSGSTGRSTAAHLHFEIVRNGQPLDPLSMVSPP